MLVICAYCKRYYCAPDKVSILTIIQKRYQFYCKECGYVDQVYLAIKYDNKQPQPKPVYRGILMIQHPFPREDK